MRRAQDVRHGDLRRALLDAAIELARDGGPDAVAREAHGAGVVLNAVPAFREPERSVQAVRSAALSAPGCCEAETQLARLRRRGCRADFARASLRNRHWLPAICKRSRVVPHGIRGPGEQRVRPDPAMAGNSAQPFQLLGAVGGMVGGALPERRPDAEYSWSAVHGLAMPCLRAAATSRAHRRTARQRVLIWSRRLDARCRGRDRSGQRETRCRPIHAGSGTVEEQRALTGIARQCCGAIEFRACLIEPAELRQQVAAYARQEMVASQRWLGGQRIDQRQARCGTECKRQRDRPIEFDHR